MRPTRFAGGKDRGFVAEADEVRCDLSSHVLIGNAEVRAHAGFRSTGPAGEKRGNRIQSQQRPADGLGDDDPQAGVTQPGEGRRNPCVACTSPDVANVSGVYFFDQEQMPPSPEAQDTETAGRLWEISERQCAVPGRSAGARS